MESKEEIIQVIIDQGMLPLFFHKSEIVSAGVVRALYRAGVRVIEYTNRGEAALKNFKILKELQASEMPDLLLGIGTIKTAMEATEFAKAGADFIVAPIVNPDVAAVATKHQLLWIPGCMTPTEIHTAQSLGAKLIKIFPANILGPAYISSIKDLFPGQLFLPTGGVKLERENIKAWFKSGVCAVGIGSKLITKEVMENGDYEQLYKDTTRAAALIAVGR